MSTSTLVLVSPSEPEVVQALGVVSPEPEVHGVDVLWTGARGRVGVQRKAVDDLVASVRDGRLRREIALMRWLSARVLLVEGRLRWSPSGLLTTVGARSSKEELRGLLLSVQLRGVWVVHTDDVDDSVRALIHLRRWTLKRAHRSLEVDRARGDPATREWGVRLLQSFPGVGPGVSGAIWDHFGGLPLAWTCTASELSSVRGVGPQRANSMSVLFGRPRPTANGDVGEEGAA